jgi:hypothetical protein
MRSKVTRPIEDRSEYWLSPLGGYTQLPDGTPILGTEDDEIVLNRDTGKRGRIVDGTFVPVEYE